MTFHLLPHSSVSPQRGGIALCTQILHIFSEVMRRRLRGTYRIICASDWLGGLSGWTRIGWIRFYSGCCSSYFLDLCPLPPWSVCEHWTAKLSACCRLSVVSFWICFSSYTLISPVISVETCFYSLCSCRFLYGEMSICKWYVKHFKVTTCRHPFHMDTFYQPNYPLTNGII